MSKLKLHICFFLLAFLGTSGTILPINLTMNLRKCWSVLPERYIINIAVYFEEFIENDYDMSLNASYYKCNSSNLPKYLKNLRRYNEAPNSFVFLEPNERDLEEALGIIEEANIPYILAQFFIVVSDGKRVSKAAEVLFKFKLYRSVILSRRRVYVMYSRGKSTKAQYLGRCEEIDSAMVAKIQKYSRVHPKNVVLNVIWSRHVPLLFDSNGTLTGIKIDALRSFASTGPIGLSFRPFNSVYLKELMSNYTFNAVQGAFDSDYADIYIGPTEVNIGQWFETGPILWLNELYYFIPKPILNLSTSMIIAMFSPLGWTVIFVSFFMWTILFTTLTNLSKRQKRKQPFEINIFVFLSFIIGYPYDIKHFKTFVPRILIASFLMLSVQLISVLQGKLFKNLAEMPHAGPVTSLMEIVDSDIPIHVSDSFLFTYPDMKDADITKLRQKYISRNIDMYILEEESLNNRNFATITDTGFFLMHPQAFKTHDILHAASMKHTIAMKKNHHLSQYVFVRMQRIVESGIVEKFTELYRFKYVLVDRNDVDYRKIDINMDILNSIFVIYDSGILSAIVALIGEKLAMRYNSENRKN